MNYESVEYLVPSGEKDMECLTVRRIFYLSSCISRAAHVSMTTENCFQSLNTRFTKHHLLPLFSSFLLKRWSQQVAVDQNKALFCCSCCSQGLAMPTRTIHTQIQPLTPVDSEDSPITSEIIFNRSWDYLKLYMLTTWCHDFLRHTDHNSLLWRHT